MIRRGLCGCENLEELGPEKDVIDLHYEAPHGAFKATRDLSGPTQTARLSNRSATPSCGRSSCDVSGPCSLYKPWRAARDASTQVLDQEHREVDCRRFGRRNKRLAAYLR